MHPLCVFPSNAERYNEFEKALLNQFFSINPYPTYEKKAEIANMLGIEHRRVDQWFTNKRYEKRTTLQTQSTPVSLGKMVAFTITVCMLVVITQVIKYNLFKNPIDVHV